ncbi:MAG: hypothetical protein ACXWUG_27835 [Polyangiales bacterium]
MSRGASIAGVLLTLVVSTACKKTPVVEDAAPANEPSVVSTAPELAAPTYGDPVTPDARPGLPMPEDPRENVDIPSGAKALPGTPGAPAPAAPVDPFESAVASVRASAVGCFAGQPKGEYSATISVVVTPAGNVSRVEASSSITDGAVIKCLEQAATRSYPSTEGGKKLSIDVQVKG